MPPMAQKNFFFFWKLKERLDQEDYEQVVMMGDFNGIINTQLDKFPKKRGGGIS